MEASDFIPSVIVASAISIFAGPPIHKYVTGKMHQMSDADALKTLTKLAEKNPVLAAQLATEAGIDPATIGITVKPHGKRAM